MNEMSVILKKAFVQFVAHDGVLPLDAVFDIAGQGLDVSTVEADFKCIYNTLLEDIETYG